MDCLLNLHRLASRSLHSYLPAVGATPVAGASSVDVVGGPVVGRSAPHARHRSGSHSRIARKQGQCFVLQWARQRQPANRCSQSNEHWQNFSQKLPFSRQGQLASQRWPGWSHGW
jgi:hypothetical protein